MLRNWVKILALKRRQSAPRNLPSGEKNTRTSACPTLTGCITTLQLDIVTFRWRMHLHLHLHSPALVASTLGLM